MPPDTASDRSRGPRLRSFWPAGPPGQVLLALVVAGVLLRLLTISSLWPTTTTLDDGYQLFAHPNPFEDPQHPAGYGLILGALGAVSREVLLPVLIQHIGGVVAGLLLYDATRRVTRSPWPGLLPAGVVLLNPDQIFLEHAIMSESWAVLVTSVALYAAVRTFDDNSKLWWLWPLACGGALGIAVVIRTAGLLLIPVVVLALLIARPWPLRSWRMHWRTPTVTAAAAATVLVAFGTLNASFGDRFGVGPSSGWYLYGRVAQFANCREFTPPAGTEALCEARPPEQRPGASYYLFEPQAPAPRSFGGFGANDDLIGEWAGRALRAQPLAFATLAWEYLRGYWVPGLRPDRPSSGVELDPQLDFTYENPFFEPTIERNLEAFFNEFTAERYEPGLKVMHAWQRVGRFGATALFLTTLLALAGLFVGLRRSRAAIVLFGLGSLALMAAPALTGNYVGRYVVPMAGPLMAAAAIAIRELLARARTRRAGGMQPNLAASDIVTRSG